MTRSCTVWRFSLMERRRSPVWPKEVQSAGRCALVLACKWRANCTNEVIMIGAIPRARPSLESLDFPSMPLNSLRSWWLCGASMWLYSSRLERRWMFLLPAAIGMLWASCCSRPDQSQCANGIGLQRTGFQGKCRHVRAHTSVTSWQSWVPYWADACATAKSKILVIKVELSGCAFLVTSAHASCELQEQRERRQLAWPRGRNLTEP